MAFLETLFGKMTATFFISMVPVIELRGAIPIGTGMGLGVWLAAVVSIFGNMMPVPFIILFTRRIFDWLRKINSKFDKIVTKLENKAVQRRSAVDKYKFWGLCILVAIPFPGTGAWTGALVAAMMEMRLKDAIPSIFLGVVIAGMLVSLATAGVVSLAF